MRVEIILFLLSTMQKYSNKTSALLMKTEAKIFDALIPLNHPFRRLNALLDFEALVNPFRSLYSDLGTTGVDVDKCLRGNMAVKFFCGFGVMKEIPAYPREKCRWRVRKKEPKDTPKQKKIHDGSPNGISFLYIATFY